MKYENAERVKIIITELDYLKRIIEELNSPVFVMLKTMKKSEQGVQDIIIGFGADINKSILRNDWNDCEKYTYDFVWEILNHLNNRKKKLLNVLEIL